MALPDKFIFSMNRVSKVVPPKRTILKDISLSLTLRVKCHSSAAAIALLLVLVHTQNPTQKALPKITSPVLTSIDEIATLLQI